MAFEYIRYYEGWLDLQTIVRIHRETRHRGVISTETAYSISSLPNQVAQILGATWHHWTTENSFHWLLDVTFREDDLRIHVSNSLQNMAVLRHLVLNILKHDIRKSSLEQKYFRAGLEDFLLLHLLTNI